MNLMFLFFVLVVILFGPGSFPQRAIAQHLTMSYWLIGSECAKEVSFRRLGIEKVIKQARRKEGHGPPYFEEAVGLDLNGDGKKEFLVRISCGGTGNCDWAVITRSPNPFLGIISGQYLYIERVKGRWPEIKTYTQMSASEGVISTYKHNGKFYRWLRDEKEVNAQLQNVPKQLVRAQALCELDGNPKYLNEVHKK